MAAFRYRAMALDGREISGVIDAETLRAARGALRARALFPLAVAAATENTAGGLGRLTAARVSGGALALLTRQWATLLAAGVPLDQSLAVLAAQEDNSRARSVLETVRGEVQAGRSLRDALACCPGSFDSLYLGLIEAGERSGQLPATMNRLADYLETRRSLVAKAVQALIYPALIALVALAVMAALLTYVVPQVVAVFASGRQTLPLMTRALLALTDGLHSHGLWLLALLGAAIYALARAWRREATRRRLENGLFGLPVIGRLLATLESMRLAEVLAVMIGSGVPLLAALESARGALRTLSFRDALERCVLGVREGTPLHRAMAGTRRFPPLLVHMVANGEASGRLDHLLARASRLQQEEFANRLGLAVALLEPATILLMGAFVLAIVLAILQPIIEINQFMR